MADLAPQELIRRTLAGERVPLARALSWVENEHPGASELLDVCFGRAGRAYRLGVTGPPGAGKSTLVTRLAQEYRRRGQTVAIVAVDPTSPFSGGALLGDRVRMNELSGDDGVFIRSMATRGSMGGLAVHTAQVCDVLDAAGFDRVLIETVGVGQSELEVAETADTTAVVLVPESGDAVQAMKAGLMEIADVFVINKADREGADRAASAIRSALHLRAPNSEWSIPVHLTVASRAEGVDALVDRFEQHLAWLSSRRCCASACGSDSAPGSVRGCGRRRWSRSPSAGPRRTSSWTAWPGSRRPTDRASPRARGSSLTLLRRPL
jgi:LAO/AO transport system kinase